MSFIKKTTDIDFGETLVENIFINDFMPMANGTHVKVYLIGFKYASDREINMNVNNQTIANHLSIPLVDVLDAWNFWESKNIIMKHKKEDTTDDNDYTVEFISLRQLYIDNNFNKATSGITTETIQTADQVSNLLAANQVSEVKEMFYGIRQLLRRSLKPNEQTKILDWMDDYGVTPDIILRAFHYSIEQRGVKNLSYVAAIIRGWYDKGIITIDKVEEELQKSDDRYASYIKILKFLGLNTSNVGDNAKNIMNKWFDTWNFDLPMIIKACENTANIPNPNLKYVDKILSDWFTNDVKTSQDVDNRKKAIKNTPKQDTKYKGKSSSKPNKFHNFEQVYHTYSNDDFEKFISNKKKK